ncbi:MAG: hypothetical protein ACKOET_12015, partial [Verrucomicrobiota bacterium]
AAAGVADPAPSAIADPARAAPGSGVADPAAAPAADPAPTGGMVRGSLARAAARASPGIPRRPAPAAPVGTTAPGGAETAAISGRSR